MVLQEYIGYLDYLETLNDDTPADWLSGARNDTSASDLPLLFEDQTFLAGSVLIKVELISFFPHYLGLARSDDISCRQCLQQYV